MVVKTMAGLKKLVAIGSALLGLVVVVNWKVRAEPSNPYTVTVAQNETRTATSEKSTDPSVNKEPEAKAEEEKESTGAPKKPLKDFRPSERIEAGQAVDFPYDI